jgi:tRNA A37 threonylcarbamoyladenosine modification protein TsaB
MQRFLSSLFASAFALTLGATSVSAATMATMAPKMMATAAPKMMKPMTCPKGQTYVKPYTKKDGTKVKGYCRKAM